MQLEFIGVGEAFDPRLGNSSYLIHSQTVLMIDCGYAVPALFFAKERSPDSVDAFYLTHFHADHCFGLPALFLRWEKEGRRKPLQIVGQPGTKQFIHQLMELAYPGAFAKLTFPIHYTEQTESAKLNELALSFAETEHSLRNLAVRIDAFDESLGISGDGALTEASKALFLPCTTLVHETFTYERLFAGHTTAKEVFAFAQTLSNLKNLVCVHIEKSDRDQLMHAFQALGSQAPFAVHIPEPGFILNLSSRPVRV